MERIKRTYSVTEYAEKTGITRMGVLYRIKNKKLPKGVSVTKVGKGFIITDNSHKYKKDIQNKEENID